MKHDIYDKNKRKHVETQPSLEGKLFKGKIEMKGYISRD